MDEIIVKFSKDEVNTLRIILDSEIQQKESLFNKYSDLAQKNENSQNGVYKKLSDSYKAEYEIEQYIMKKINDAITRGV